MNKIYKIVWSKVKQCYVVASELAKRHTKSPKSGVVSKTVVVGALVCVLSCGAVMPKMAEAKTLIADNTQQYSYVGNSGPLNYVIPGMSVNGKVDVIKLANSFHLFDPDRPYGTRGYTNKIFVHTDISGNVRYFASAAYEGYSSGDNEITYYKTYELTESEVNAALGSGANVSALVGGGSSDAITGLSVNGRTITYTKGDGSTGTITTQDTDTTYSAGNGVSLSGTTFSAKAGTNVTVNGNGISVTGNGTVASGNTGLIDGGKLYTELRSSANGNYVKHKNSI